ncbi:LacI family DNA-binding transcriptional regulator [Adhaeribacter pallidiroseus]|uniref:HTH-type transcriptional regulator AglR n=1 Tax=Adhaeribacter pallidiroseus TaxID=2072847 RepID=A0A369QH13_9BACT|nr:LacI family DNA-binding transcriptional regulator [Adhaeribacter pallidiroseus]RDC62557.1 HTH-type transcriptional regulator AglR [Adhaeribacter pallidiroseus]
MEKKNIRIKDIAQLAGVSIGTVDRVLHNRGKVSEEALQKVLSTLREIDYKPNLIARTLGTKKVFRIAVIIPDPAQDEYWAQAHIGIRHAAAEWDQYDVYVETHFFDLYHKESFLQLTQSAHLTKPDGIVIAPIFYHEALHFLHQCQASKIPFVIFNTNIPEIHPLSFIGQNLFDSGRVAAELMSLGQDLPGTFAVLHVNEASENSIHLLDKQRGFEHFFKVKNQPEFKTMALDITETEEAKLLKQVQGLLKDNQLKGIFVTTSKGTSTIAGILEKLGNKDLRLIGYDLLPENVEHLQAGTIDFLINQNSKHQTFLGIQHLANFLFLKKEPPARNLLPLEIITRENVNSYLGSALPQT